MSAGLILAQGNQLLPCLACRGKKSLLVAQPFQLIARTKREAYQWSGSGGRGKRRELADKDAAIPPEGRSPLPLGIQEVPKRYALFLKEREAPT